MNTAYKIAVLVALGSVMAACAKPPAPVVIDQTRTVVIAPPETLLKCPELKQLPNPDTLTNQQAVSVISKLVENNQTCAINMAQIKAYVTRAKVTHAD
jgi:hypothetical protein